AAADEEPARDRRISREELAAELGAHGADRLVVPEDAECPPARSSLATWLAAAIAASPARAVLAPATALGREIAPAIAAELGLGLTGDAIGVRLDAEGRLEQLKPAFGGQVVAPILSRTRPELVTLRPGIVARAACDRTRPPAAIEVRAGYRPDPRVRRRRFVSEVGPEGAALEEARVVVCVGWGLDEASLPAARELAERLGGTVAATRRVC